MRLRHVVLAAAGALIGSVLVEASLRLVEATPLRAILPVAEVALYGPDPDTGYAHRAGVSGLWLQENRAPVAINGLGLRDRLDRTLAKPSGAVRWGIAGDSITEALQVPLEATFPYLTEARMRGREGPIVEVVNLGLAGATPAVIAERGRTLTSRLHLDGLVIIKSIVELGRTATDDPSEYPGYIAAADGSARLSHAFRDSAGYRLRTSERGQGMYRLLDTLRIARVLNSRKNVGLLAELRAAPPARERSTPDACDDAAYGRQRSLWLGADTTFADRRLAAFLEDLARISRERSIPVILALQSIADPCPGQSETGPSLREAITARAARHGLRLVDLDRALRARLRPGQPLKDLHGFGVNRGGGHLNEDGHRVYADVLASVLIRADCDRRSATGC